MKLLLPGLGSVVLGLAAAGVLFLVVMMRGFSARGPSPDGGDALGIVLVAGVTWLALALGVVLVLARGGFDWVSPRPGVPSLAVLTTTLAVAGLSVASALAWNERSLEHRALLGPAGAVLLPLVAIAFLGVLLWAEPASHAAWRWLRPAGLAFVGLGGVAVVLGAMLQVRVARDTEARLRDEAAADDALATAHLEAERAREAADDAALAALPDDAPLEAFVAHCLVDKSEAHRRAAVARVQALPNLPARLATALEAPAPLDREKVLELVRRAAPVDPAWAPAMKQSLARLAGDYRDGARDPAGGQITHVRGLALGSLAAARAFGAVRFDDEVRALRDALTQWPPGEERDEALAAAEAYLAGAR